MRIYFLLLMFALLTACSDEEVLVASWPVHPPQPGLTTRTISYPSSLVKDAHGHWKATRRVPLVGKGRIVDDISNALVSALSTHSKMAHLVDEDLTNCASFGVGVANIGAIANQIAAVRDLHRTYAAGQKVGFVFKVANSSLLTAKVLKSFWLQTFLHGQPVEAFGNKEGSQVLELDLISIANRDGIKELSFTATQPFDEVQFNIAGVNAELLQSLSIYYAFVGENELKPAVTGSTYFPDAHLHKGLLWTNIRNPNHITDNDLTNYAYYGTISGLLGDPCVTVDFGREVPAGSEVGFVLSSVDILNLSLATSIVLETYDAQNTRRERVSLSSVLDLSAVKVSNQSRVSMITTQPCRQLYINFKGVDIKLGGTNVYYAYAVDQVTVDASSRFSVTDVTISGNTYTLPTPPGGTTEWMIVSAPQGSRPSIHQVTAQGTTTTKIIHMTENGDYHLHGTFTPTPTGNEVPQAITVDFVIHRQALTVGQQCNQLIGTAYGARIGDISGGGSLLSIGQFKHPEYVIDDDPDNYATFVNPLALAANVGIGAIDLTHPVNAGQKPIRVGFTLQTSFDLLGADVLKTFQIRLYYQGREVERKIVDKSDVGTVSLIGSQGNKVRMGIRTRATFDHIELWTVGVLNLKIQGFRLYHAYWEDDTADCPTTNLSEVCMELLTAANGAEIQYEHTSIDGVATVGGTFENLGNLIDEDKESFAIGNATSVIGSLNIAVKFPPLPGNSRIGMIVQPPTGIADLSLLKGTVVEVWSHGAKATQDITGDLLDIELIGHGGRAYLETAVTNVTAYDEVRIRIPAAADALKTYKVFGIYTRRDSNGNGIPDCAEDEENPAAPVDPLTAEVKTPHLCEGDSLSIAVIKGGKPGETYTLTAYNTFRNNEQTTLTQVLSADRHFHWKGLVPGHYFIRILHNGKEVTTSVLEAQIHPLQTTWKQQPVTTQWNNWNNWVEGAPWKCTNVILPSGCRLYPELTAEPEYCANLHLASHAELVHSHLLDGYDYVWMELTLQSGRNYLLSAPLAETVTGDYFIPAQWQGKHQQERYFTPLTAATSPENRFAPRLFQRFWSSTVPGKIVTNGSLGTTVITHETDWTAPFNAVAEPLHEGQGWMVRAEAELLPAGELTFRFPKTHAEYSYFDATGTPTGFTEKVTRSTASLGRWAFSASQVSNDTYTVTVRNLKAGTTFVVGNPFPTHLNIHTLLQANRSVIREVKITNGNGTYTTLLQGNQTVSTAPGFTHIAPLQACYVTALQPVKELTLKLTAAMQEQRPGYDLYATPPADTSPTTATGLSASPLTRGQTAAPDCLTLTAHSKGQSTQCLVTLRPGGREGYSSDEDTRLLYDREQPATVAVFTIGNGEALDIQQLPLHPSQPIGIGWRMEHPADVTLQLSHPSGSEWTHWVLENRATGQRYSLSQPETTLSLGMQQSVAGQWQLVRGNLPRQTTK